MRQCQKVECGRGAWDMQSGVQLQRVYLGTQLHSCMEVPASAHVPDHCPPSNIYIGAAVRLHVHLPAPHEVWSSD